MNNNENNSVRKKPFIGETSTANNGLKMTIVDMYKTDDKHGTRVVVKFEDGAVVKDRSLQNFRRGKIAHPQLKTRGECIFLGNVVRKVFRLNDGRVYYECTNPQEEPDIMTITEILKAYNIE